MKTIKILDLMTESINVVGEIIDMIDDRLLNVERESDRLAELTSNEGLALSMSMGVARDLFNELPEKIREKRVSDDERDVLSNFFQHLYEDGEVTRFEDLRSSYYTVHEVFYRLYKESRLYTS